MVSRLVGTVDTRIKLWEDCLVAFYWHWYRMDLAFYVGVVDFSSIRARRRRSQLPAYNWREIELI